MSTGPVSPRSGVPLLCLFPHRRFLYTHRTRGHFQLETSITSLDGHNNLISGPNGSASTDPLPTANAREMRKEGACAFVRLIRYADRCLHDTGRLEGRHWKWGWNQ